MKLELYYVVRRYTYKDSIEAFGEICYHAGPFRNWVDADNERCNLKVPENYVVVYHELEVKE